MCTVILLYRQCPDTPIIIAANRDEFINRSALPPDIWPIAQYEKAPEIFAGKDQKEGGTWLGVNRYGLVAGLTNYYTGTRDPLKTSRGKLILECLKEESPTRIKKKWISQKTNQYNPFTLFCVTPEEGFSFSNYPKARMVGLKKGVSVYTNGDMEDEQDPKRKWLLERLNTSPLPAGPADFVPLFSQLLSSHGHQGSQETCIHHPPGYGTVSSCVLFIHKQLEKSRYFYCPGSPCEKSYKDLSLSFVKLFS